MAELNIKNFPDELHKRLKIQAAKEDITLRNLIVSILENPAPVLILSKRKPAK